MRKADYLTTFLISLSLTLLESSGYIQACNGNSLPVTFVYIHGGTEFI